MMAAQETWRIFEQAWAAGLSGIVSVTTSSSKAELEIRSIACAREHRVRDVGNDGKSAAFFEAPAALQSVPAVSTISSVMMQVRPQHRR